MMKNKYTKHKEKIEDVLVFIIYNIFYKTFKFFKNLIEDFIVFILFNVFYKKIIKPYKERKKINAQKEKMKEEYKKTIKIINE